jgi:hypothetical protein
VFVSTGVEHIPSQTTKEDWPPMNADVIFQNNADKNQITVAARVNTVMPMPIGAQTCLSRSPARRSNSPYVLS